MGLVKLTMPTRTVVCPNYVNLKKGPVELGRYGYDVILEQLKLELIS